MKKNVGATDRNIRLALAGILVLAGIATGQIVLSVLGLVVLATAATGVCLAYLPFKIDTTKKDSPSEG